jgi:hypothetical protein
MKTRIALILVGMALFAAAPVLARPSSSGSPQAFAQRLLHQLNSTGPDSWVTQHIDGETDPSFRALIDENGALAQRHYGGVDQDYDPVCQCQDSGGHFTLLSLIRQGADTANLRIRISSEPPTSEAPTLYTIQIKRIGGAWRIYDVLEGHGSVRQRLIHHNACMRESRDAAVIDRCFAH